MRKVKHTRVRKERRDRDEQADVRDYRHRSSGYQMPGILRIPCGGGYRIVRVNTKY